MDIRLISAEALIKLVKLKENSDDPETGRKIRSVLTPMEYTRLDRLVDVMFTTAIDVSPSSIEEQDVEPITGPPEISMPNVDDAQSLALPAEIGKWEFTDPQLLQQKRDQIVPAMSTTLNSSLIKKSRALFWSADHSRRIACTISKRYEKRSSYPYWYAFHPQWDQFLGEGQIGYLVLGCMDLPIAFAVPHENLRGILSDLNTTETERGKYWHIHLVRNESMHYEILLPKREFNLPISEFEIDLANNNTR